MIADATIADSMIAAVVHQLQVKLASLGDGAECHSDRAIADYHALVSTLQRTISALRSAPVDLDTLLQRLADVEASRAIVTTKIAEVEQQLAEAPAWASLDTRVERDAAYERQQHLRQQLDRLREGRLLRSPDEFFPHVADLDAQARGIEAKLVTVRARIAASLKQAAALLADAPVTS